MAVGLAAPWLASPAGAWAATRPALAEFFKPRQVLDAALSPDGQRIAILRQDDQGDRRRSYVLVVDANDLSANPRPVTLEQEAEYVSWANDERLLIWITAELKAQPTLRDIPTDIPKFDASRILSVGADGRDPVVLFGSNPMMLRSSVDLGTVVDGLPDDPRHILMSALNYSTSSLGLYKVDVYSGDATLMERGLASTMAWDTRDGVPLLRYSANPRRTIWTVEARAPGEKNWKQVRKYHRHDWSKSEFDVLAYTDDPNVVIAMATDANRPFRQLRKFDLRTLELGEVVAAAPGHDLDGALVDDWRVLIGSFHTADRETYDFVDKSLNAHFKGINKYFGDECNVSVLDFNRSQTRFLFWVSGPRDAPAIYFYDKEAKRLEPLGQSMPWLTRERLAPMEALKVKTRDGSGIDAYLTVPSAPGPRPLVVMPHGGPQLRDSIVFDTWVQAFAAQGWMVLQPNFRGSWGYGRAFSDAGHRRWGDRMQEDVEDAVAQVVASGRVDPKRIAIFGARYGGYAALMGAIRRPDLYRSAVSVAGLADLPQMIENERSEEGAESADYAYWVEMVGDPKADAAMLASASPARRAAEIQAPVLLIHGSEDRIIPPSQSKAMAEALKRAGKTYELVELPQVQHRGWDHKTQQTILERSIRFMAKSLDA